MFKGFRIESELSEKQIESDVATYLGMMTPPGSRPFRLLDVNEQLTGADKRIDLLIPIYLQFKVSDGLTPFRPKIHRFFWPSSRLQRIRQFRFTKSLNDSPTLYFQLRDLAPTASDYQHNILLSMAHLCNGNAYYVAPLALKKQEYEKFLEPISFRLFNSPFTDEHIRIYYENWVSHLGFVPFLRNHISIRPIDKVLSANHYYSYAMSGSEIGWHSPAIIQEDARLSTRLVNIFYSAYTYRNYWRSIVDYLNEIRAFSSTIGFSIGDGNNDILPIYELQAFGRYLYSTFGIMQFLVTADRNDVEFFTGKLL